MQSVLHQTNEGFESFVDKQMATEGDCRITLHQFDTVFDTVYRNRPIHRVPALNLQPRGGTALFDAMGYAITDTAKRIEKQANQPAQTIVLIITDGLENSSREFNREQVFSLVRHYTDSADWQFVYLGANQDAIAEAAQMGIDSGAAMTYAATCRGAENAWDAMGVAVERQRAAKVRRVKGSYFTCSERRAAMDED